MIVLHDGRLQALRVAISTGLETIEPFHNIPTVIESRPDQVDFLDPVLSNVARPEVSGSPVE